jgi:xylan 1,4-beta-xylosidase
MFLLGRCMTIPVPEHVESIWLRVDVDKLVYRYAYSFDGKQWHTVR